MKRLYDKHSQITTNCLSFWRRMTHQSVMDYLILLNTATIHLVHIEQTFLEVLKHSFQNL